MYNIIEVEEYIRLPPYVLRMEKEKAAREIILNIYRNRYLSDIGLILDVIDVKMESENMVVMNDPNIYVKTRFKLLSFTIESGEIVLGVVREVVEYGAFVLIGPFEALLNLSQISDEKFKFNKEKKRLENEDGSKTIEVGDKIYAKVSTVSMKEGPAKAKISLTCRSAPYLGNLKWLNSQNKPVESKKRVRK